MPARKPKHQLPAKLPPDAYPQTLKACREALTACHEALYECLEALAAYRDLETLKFPDQPERRAALERLCLRLGIDFGTEPIWLWVLIGLELARDTPEFKPRKRRGRKPGSRNSVETYDESDRVLVQQAAARAAAAGSLDKLDTLEGVISHLFPEFEFRKQIRRVAREALETGRLSPDKSEKAHIDRLKRCAAARGGASERRHK
ncbi:MAG: hypothetical protein AB1749_11555 [Pseudomonadota bacterium]